VALDAEATVETVADGMTAHPTLSEAIKEAGLLALGRAIHMPNKKSAAAKACGREELRGASSTGEMPCLAGRPGRWPSVTRRTRRGGRGLRPTREGRTNGRSRRPARLRS